MAGGGDKLDGNPVQKSKTKKNENEEVERSKISGKMEK